MGRLGIFVFYNEKGYVGEYIEYLLESIRGQLEDLIVVCNGKLSEHGRAVFERFSDQILVRPNVGYDAGAYAQTIKKLYDERIIDEYDELLLFNDTFFGPFVPFEIIFSAMEKKQVDFWGLAWAQTEYLPLHVNSYFINFGTKIVRSRFLYDFFDDMDMNVQNVTQVVIRMEFSLTEELITAGYSWAAYCEENAGGVLYSLPYDLLVNHHLPILKVKSFDPSLKYGFEITRCLEYLENHGRYDCALIERQTLYKYGHTLQDYRADERSENIRPVPSTNLEGVRQFCDMFPEIYIYGAGYYGSIFLWLIGEKVKGYIVSDDHYQNEDYEGVTVYKLSQIEDRETGIVVALKAKYTQEVRMKLKEFQNVLFLWK